jgi:hypothetical protein
MGEKGYKYVPFGSTTDAILYNLGLFDRAYFLEKSYQLFSPETSSKLLNEDCAPITFILR